MPVFADEATKYGYLYFENTITMLGLTRTQRTAKRPVKFESGGVRAIGFRLTNDKRPEQKATEFQEQHEKEHREQVLDDLLQQSVTGYYHNAGGSKEDEPALESSNVPASPEGSSTPKQQQKRAKTVKREGVDAYKEWVHCFDGRNNIPSVVNQGRCQILKTPYAKRKNDVFNTFRVTMETLKGMLFGSTKWSNERKNEEMKEYSDQYFTKTKTGSKMKDIVEGLADEMKDLKPIERRPIMAYLTKHLYKRDVEELLANTITKHEWQMAKHHYELPGPFKPVAKYRSTRQRFKLEVLCDFMGFLTEGYMQDHAYGDKNAVSSTGAMIQIEAVSILAHEHHIYRNYNKKFRPENDQLQDNERCTQTCKKTRERCMKPLGHDGQHKYTDESMLSLSSVQEIIKAVTNGQLKSRAGLDDEDVNKGSRNIDRMIELYNILAKENKHSEEIIAKMEDRINQIRIFHKTNFPLHLSRNGSRCCQCISCGLHCSEEPVECMYREQNHDVHGGPCRDCDESFKVVQELLAMAGETQKLLNISNDEQLSEKYFEVEKELEICKQNLIDWRSHIVRKVVESKYSREQMQNLKEDEAIVVCDFKMKILPHFLKETKNEFFGKRGTACLGFMIITNTEQKEGEVDVQFYFFFSDDTKQDSNFVLCGKHYIYKEILPRLFPNNVRPIKVLFESDGAGAYNSFLAKGAMPWWKVWTNDQVEECRIRQSVAGDGKSPLDGAFGKLGSNLRDAVNNGLTDVCSAASCLQAYAGGAGIQAASASVIELVREFDLDNDNKIPRLRLSHCMDLDRENGKIVTFAASGYGRGIEIGLDEMKSIFSEEPSPPQYIVSSEFENNGTAQHSSESHQKRVQQQKQSKRTRRNAEIDERVRAEVNSAKQKGVFLCDQIDPVTRMHCKYSCKSQEKLNEHKMSGEHKFPSRRLRDAVIGLSGTGNGTLVVGSRYNRSDAFADVDVEDGTSTISDGDNQFKCGCYLKPKPKPKVRMNEELKRHLIEMFEEGEDENGKAKPGRNKWKPNDALKALADMELPSGLKKFSSRSQYGDLPKVSQIVSFWSRYRSSLALQRTKRLTQEELTEESEYCAAALEMDVVYEDEEDGKIAEAVKPKKKLKAQRPKNHKTKQKGPLKNLTFVVDGDFSLSHDEVSAMITDNSGVVKKNLGQTVNYLIAGRGSEKASKLSKPKEQQKYPILEIKDYEWLKRQLSEQAMPSQQIIIDETAIEVTVGNTE